MVLRKTVQPYVILKGETMQDHCKAFSGKETKFNMIFNPACTLAEAEQLLWNCKGIWAYVHLLIFFNIYFCAICSKPYTTSLKP